MAIGDWNSPSAHATIPSPFGRVEDAFFFSDLTQTGALQGIVALNFVVGARLTRLNTKSGGNQRVHLPAGSAGGFFWYCQNVLIDHSRFGHEERVSPTPDGEGIDFEGGNENIIFRNNVLDFNFGPGMLVMDQVYDYEIVHSWMLGREINNGYYSKFPSKFARWDYASRVAFYPCIFDGRVPQHVAVGTCAGQSNCATRHADARDLATANYSAAVAHFIEYVDGACSAVGGEPSICVYP